MKQTINSISGAVGVNRLPTSFDRRQPIVLTLHGASSGGATISREGVA